MEQAMTDQFPRGKLNADDEGQLAIAIATKDKTLIIDFGKPVTWLGLDYHTAMALAGNIMMRAQEIKPKTDGAR
jgi:hypothetical protein